ncbi:TM0106 family RecB-like putative nuclease [Polaromonas hydrogenivorans]|uniref:TM0106 family RecB-like putative nuclease n=1 Tax=Polaromonas hydrogenivorans TaxID=335476 RepID=A0AAU7LZP0_9BURK
MEASDTLLSAAILRAFLKCPTKARFLALGKSPQETYFSDVEAGISSTYKSRAWRMLHDRGELVAPATFEQIADGDGSATRWFDCDTAVCDLALSQRGLAEPRAQKSASGGRVVPVLFSPWEKPVLSDSLLVSFGARSLSQATRTQVETGILVYGDNLRRKTIRISDHAAQLNRVFREIGSLLPGGRDPPLVLNAHCSVCDFWSKCRGVAIEQDDLSLLSGMTVKDRSRALAKGILTISQLSYGYRPRRRKRTKPDAERAARSNDAAHTRPPAKHDNKLKALAIKSGRIHVVGAPAIKLEGVPTFIDVEGMPDRDSYYLVGLRFEFVGGPAEHAFWADGPEDEQGMWEDCLRTLKSIGNAQLVHYGAYETRFLRTMKKRYSSEPDEAEFVDRLIGSSINLVACIYGSVYFPTYSNSLKEVARHLGYDWAWPHASGAASVLMRKTWELSAVSDVKPLLLAYNMDDCRAAAVVADALTRICAGGPSAPDSVNVGSLEVGFQRTFGKFDSALPEFSKINDAAYWDYQRSKVFVRTDKSVRRTVRKSERRRNISGVEKEITIDDTPANCPKCSSTKLWKYPPRRSNIVYDLKFSRKGVKRWAVKYRYGQYKCSECHAEMTFYKRELMYGPSLRAFLVYLLIELLLSNRKAAEHASLLFDLRLAKSAVGQIKSEMAEKYTPTYQHILKQIAGGNLIHADETKGVVLGGGHYVWVFANMTTVAYVYAESRESAILENLLDGFKGVLVSDFYAAYDSVPCPQQKCLIHLMRDINEDLNRNPFNEELKAIAGRFGALLREIVETVDRYGLKARHLGKHRRSAEGFIEHVAGMNCTTEVGLALKKRIGRNSDKLFTFLSYDGVPWNNNNAEHAVRAFTRLRNVINTSSPKGTRDYATLLSIQQTLRYRGHAFLEFMRSGEMKIPE